MAENGLGPGDNPETLDQTEEAVEVRKIEPKVAAAELRQQAERIKNELSALEEAKRVPQNVLELVVSI